MKKYPFETWKTPEGVTDMPEIVRHMQKGFKLTFPNGTGVSVQFGYGTYSDAEQIETNFKGPLNNPAWVANSAEVMIFADDKDLINCPHVDPESGGEPLSRVTIDQLMEIMNYLWRLEK